MVAHVSGLVEELTAQRAEERIGETRRGARRVRRRRPRSWAAPPTRARRSTVRRPSLDAADVAVGDLVAADRRGQRRAWTWWPEPVSTAMSETVNAPGSNWNLPNVLTGLRIVMVPFFGWALLHDGGDSCCGGPSPSSSSSAR